MSKKYVLNEKIVADKFKPNYCMVLKFFEIVEEVWISFGVLKPPIYVAILPRIYALIFLFTRMKTFSPSSHISAATLRVKTLSLGSHIFTDILSLLLICI